MCRQETTLSVRDPCLSGAGKVGFVESDAAAAGSLESTMRERRARRGLPFFDDSNAEEESF